MSKLQDEFNMGRIPIRPLAYENKDKAYTQELMIDISRSNPEETPSMHLYITDSNDRSIVHDITSLIIQEAFAGKEILIAIDGVQEPVKLHDVISYIYTRFVHMNNPSGFNKTDDLDKVMHSENVTVLLQDVNNRYVFPITRTDAVYDIDGNTLQSKLDSICRVGFINDYIKVTYDDQNSFNIVYPFPNYFVGGNYMQLMIGTTIIDKSRYQVVENTGDDGKAYSATINFYTDTFERGRRIDILYIYNAPAVSGDQYNAIDGHTIANTSIPTSKMEKVSSSYVRNDPDTLATSKSVHDLYETITDLFGSDTSKAVFCRDDTPGDTHTITVNVANDGIVLGSHYILVTVVAENYKAEDVALRVVSLEDSIHKVPITNEFNTTIENGASKGRVLKFLVSESNAVALNVSNIKLACTRYIYYCAGSEIDIPFTQLDLADDGIIRVYRNGVRLFEDVDYSINMITKSIKLYTRANANERIIFECEYIAF